MKSITKQSPVLVKHPITVYQFDEAPKELQKLSTNGGDEDWLVELPPGYEEHGTPYWIDCTGSYQTDHYKHPFKTDWKVVIGSHA